MFNLPSESPALVDSRTRSWRQSATAKVALILLGTLVLSAASRISVPMLPVPMTMQTLAVTIIGAMYGWRLGALTILTWLGQGALGLPVFAGGTGGIARFVGPTAGYLFAFPVAGALTGWLVERGWDGRRPALAMLSMLIGNAMCLVGGALWLATTIGVHEALAVGVTPFVMGAALKSVLGAMLIGGIHVAERTYKR